MIENVLFVFFLINSIYVFLLAIAGHFYRKKEVPATPLFKKIAIFVPSYKEDSVILHTTQELLALDYPASAFNVIVIADSLQEKTIKNLSATKAIILPVSFDKSMKSRSLNYAFNQLDEHHDIAIIADADNILSKNFLRDINNLFNAGYTIIQAQRVAKNLSTPMAVLDGLSEAINNHLFRQGSNALGLSSALIGSGMAFPYKLLKEKLSKIDSVVEDRDLQLALLESGHFITYQKGLLVYDEKVESPEAYKNQRRRWIAGQYSVLRKNLFKGLRLLFNGNINFFHSAVIQNVFPSRIISMISLVLLFAIFTLVYNNTEITIRWSILMFLYFLALVISTPKNFLSAKTIKALMILPIVAIKTIQSIFLSRNGTKTFIHTEHKQREIESTISRNEN